MAINNVGCSPESMPERDLFEYHPASNPGMGTKLAYGKNQSIAPLWKSGKFIKIFRLALSETAI
jgi:hypothetical protein